jgi:hypothetical protein
MKAEEICRNSGATRIDDDHVLIQYLYRPYHVTISTGDVFLKDKEEELIATAVFTCWLLLLSGLIGRFWSLNCSLVQAGSCQILRARSFS